jgi:hypothetical protein
VAAQQFLNANDSLVAMTEYNWMTYLPSNRICSALATTLAANKYINQVFGLSIASYRRDDFTTKELPALSIYEPTDAGKSRFFPLNGSIIFDIYLPIRITRQETERIFNTLGQAVVLIFQQPSFFYNLGQNMIPLPPTTSQIYNDVLTYKQEHGCPLVNIGDNYEITQPVKASIGTDQGIADAWKQQIRFTYQTDLSNFYAMLEGFGISFDYDPNTIVFEPLDDFAVTITPESAIVPISESLTAYIVTTAEGYSDNGLLVIPEGITYQGILLGNNSVEFRVPLALSPPVYGKVSYYYVNVVTSRYLSTGVLMIASPATTGYGAVLIGDNGYVYNVTYDGTVFYPQRVYISAVTASSVYPVNGTLLSKAYATVGNAQILFGIDGNIYTIIVP